MKIPSIPLLIIQAAEAARQRSDGADQTGRQPGTTEKLSADLAGMTGQARPKLQRKAVIVMAADHGVALEGVSAYPAEVTRQMVLNFLNGGAAINVLTRQANARVVVVDIGVASEFEAAEGLVRRKVMPGTRNMAAGPPYTCKAERAVQTGMMWCQRKSNAVWTWLQPEIWELEKHSPSSAIVSIITG